MQKKPGSQSGLFNARVLLAFTLCLAGAWLAMLSFASAGLNASSSFGGPDPTIPNAPRYQNFYAPAGTSAEPSSGEFNIGFDPITHRIMTMNYGAIWRLTPPEFLTPAKPACCEALWEDKSATVTNTGLDPILWTDQKTGRTFASNSTAGANAVYAYTDAAAPFNDGDVWIEVGAAPANGGIDHQTIGSGPYPALLSKLSTPVNQGEAVYYCSQAGVGPASCQRSDDLGSSYGAGVLAYDGFTTACGGLHGHLHVAPNGTVWLPANQCGGQQGGSVSTTAGVTWTEFIVSGTNDVTGGADFSAVSQAHGADPSIGIDSDSVAYYCYVNNEGDEGHVHVAVSTDGGQTWIRDVDVGASHGIINAAETEAVGGSAGRAACGFIGTNVSGSYESGNFPGVWYAFIATTYDQGRTWVTVNATPNDPVQNHTGIWQQGGSGETGDRNLLDFNEITLDDKGRVLYGYSDGCHSQTCIQSNNSDIERGAFMRVARQSGGKPLLAQFDPSPPEPVLSKPACLSGTRDCFGIHLNWKAPDNGGSDIINYQIFRSTAAGAEALLGQTGNGSSTTFDDPVDPSVRHYFYVVKAINGLGTGPMSNEIDMSSELIPIDDTATTLENQAVTINVLANDCGVPPLTVTSVSAALHGSVNNNGDGTVTYTPANGFFGPDSFTCTIRNGLGATLTSAVRITVNPLCPLINIGSFSDNFESGAPGWTVETPVNAPGSVPWTRIADPSAHSPTMDFFTDNAATQGGSKDDRLISPPQLLSATSHLIFYHRFDLEPSYDGGVLEVSTDGGASYTDITKISAANEFISGGYNVTMDSGPLAGHMAWNGRSPGFPTMTKVEVDLSALSGQRAIFRWRLRADNLNEDEAAGWWVDDVQFTNTLVEGPCPAIVSRKTHGGAGSFNINLPLTGASGIECRSGGTNGDHTIVFTFANTLTSVAAANVTSGTGSVSSRMIDTDAHQYIVNLTGVTNGQKLTLALSGVTDSMGTTTSLVAVPMNVLLGDANANKAVTSSDVSSVKAQVGASLTTSNFREDVNANGAITSSDVSVTKAQVGTTLP